MENNDTLNKIWDELVKLDYFLHNEFIDFMKGQTDIRGEDWDFVHKPHTLIKTEKFNIPEELFNFCIDDIFQKTLFDNFNILFDYMRVLLKARKNKDNKKEDEMQKKITELFWRTANSYSKKVFEFKEIMYRIKSKDNSSENFSTDNIFEVCDNIKNKIAKGEIDLAFRESLEISKSSKDLYNKLILLNSSLSRLEMDYRMGVLDLKERNIEHSKIVNGLLVIVDNIKAKN